MRIVLLLGLIIFQSCNTSSETLAFNLSSASPKVYHLNTKLQLLSDSAQTNFFSEADLSFSKKLITHFADNSGRFSIQIDSIDFRSNQYSVEECRHIEHYITSQSTDFKINPQGELLDMSKPLSAEEMEISGFNLINILLKIQPSLPKHATTIGATWEKQLKMPSQSKEGGDNYLYKWFKVAEIYSNGEKRFAKIITTLKYKIEDKKSMIVAKDNFILGQGFIVFNIDDGDIEFGEFEISGNVNFKIADTVFPDYQILQTVTIQRVL